MQPYKVEKILKGSLNSTPSTSTSEKVQMMGGKVYLSWNGKPLLGFVNKLFFVDITQQGFALLPQVNFPVNDLNFYKRWRWWEQIQAIFLNLFYFNGVMEKYSRL